MLFDPLEAEDAIDELGQSEHLASVKDLIARGLSLFKPPANISSTECAEEYRKIRTPKGDATRPWSRELTPYLVGPQDALDDPTCTEVIIPKPGRTGGTIAFENFLFRMMRFGPMGDVGWFLKSDSEVSAYAAKGFKEIFDLHSEIQNKVGTGVGDDKLAHKKVDGRTIDLLPANPTKFTNRQFWLMVGDEIDTYTPRICASFIDQCRIRGRALGTDRKVAMTSHPDRGWSTGIAMAWVDTSRGIYVWPCAECSAWSSPHPTKFWKDVRATEVWFREAEEGTNRDEAIAMAEDTAALKCPHCGSLIDDEQRHEMIDLGQWMHRGQTLDVELGVCGEPEENSSRGFWIHGTMSKMITVSEIARDLATARIEYRNTRKTEKLQEITAKVLGEVFEGAAGAGKVNSATLIQRRKDARVEETSFEGVTLPDEVLFCTQAIDVGHRKFDIMVRGWAQDGRSWLIQRETLKTIRLKDGTERGLRTSERQDDWHVLDSYIQRHIPFASDPDMALPIAMTLIDSGDGNVTWKAYEYVRRMDEIGWGKFKSVRAIKGSSNVKALEIPKKGTPVEYDQDGGKVEPVIRVYELGVHKLKQLELERLAVDDGSPGQWHIADDIDEKFIEEFFGERLIGGKFERHGDNETLDLAAYTEAARLMMGPDRQDIQWGNPDRRPPWAKPILINQPEQEVAPVSDAKPKGSLADRLGRLNQPPRR